MTQELLPSPNGPNDRDAGGRFVRGNAGGPGNPYAKRVAELRSGLLDAVDTASLQRVMSALIQSAEAGDVPAARLLLEYTIGRPRTIEEADASNASGFVYVFRLLAGDSSISCGGAIATPPF